MTYQTNKWGSELWRINSTTSTEEKALSSLPQVAASSSEIDFLRANKDWLYIVPSHATEGFEVWNSDGTDGNTQQISSNPTGNSFDYSAGFLVAGKNGVYYSSWLLNSYLYGSSTTPGASSLISNAAGFWLEEVFPLAQGDIFVNYDDSYALYSSDGSAGGTVRLNNLTSNYLIAATDTACLFSADDGVHGSEPWITDGTIAGTKIVSDFCSGTCSGNLDLAVTFASKFYLMITDSVGVVHLKSFYTDGTGDHLEDLAVVSGVDAGNLVASAVGIFFTQDDGIHGNELFIYDFRSHSISLAADINPGAGSSAPKSLHVVSNHLVLKAKDSTSTYRIYSLALPPL